MGPQASETEEAVPRFWTQFKYDEAEPEVKPRNIFARIDSKWKFGLKNLLTQNENALEHTSYDWLASKKKRDDIGNYWRVHDSLYDLSEFKDKHPGGKDWIEVSQGTDITEAFETSHIINQANVEKILAKYFIKKVEKPRSSPYTFKEDGFYKTLKRRVGPVLKEIGTGPTKRMLLMQDVLVSGYIVFAIIGVSTGSVLMQIIAGIFLGMCVVGAHNFLHLRDTWRRFYFDISPMSSYEFRVTHGLSHHLFPNTPMDFEVTAMQPMLELLPSRQKSLFQRYGSLIYAHLLYTQIMGFDMLKRAWLLGTKKAKLRPENLLILYQLLICVTIAPSVVNGMISLYFIYSVASYWLAIVGLNAAHHHPACFHDGDEPRKDPDFGLCQLDATLDKADDFHKTELAVLTTFGEHPLHHLFPTICHSKLPFLRNVFEETLKEFLEQNRAATQLELFIGTHRQFARVTGWSHDRQRNYKFPEISVSAKRWM